jgi:hypothetical protein
MDTTVSRRERRVDTECLTRLPYPRALVVQLSPR